MMSGFVRNDHERECANGECKTPFVPTSWRPALCSQCYNKEMDQAYSMSFRAYSSSHDSHAGTNVTSEDALEQLIDALKHETELGRQQTRELLAAHAAARTEQTQDSGSAGGGRAANSADSSSVTSASEFEAAGSRGNQPRPRTGSGGNVPSRSKVKHHIVMGESIEPDASFVSQTFPKPESARALIRQALADHFLFGSLDVPKTNEIISAMRSHICAVDDVLIQQGDDGDNFYVVESGAFNYLVNGKVVGSVGPGGSFGELALLYNSPRAATVQATSPSVVWAVDRRTFRRILATTADADLVHTKQALQKVELLRSLTPVQLSRIAVAVKRQEFQKGDRIITKGDEGETMYFLKQGTVRITGVGSGRETVEFALGAGSYFGERALLLGAKRAANVIVTSPTALCLTLDRHVLDQVIGSLREVLDHNMGVSALKTIPYFVSTLRERDINKLAESLVVVSYEPGEIIQHASTAGSTFYLIREGSALEVEGEAEDFTSLPYASASGGSDTNASALSAAYTASTSPMRQGHKPTATASGSSNVVRVLTAGDYFGEEALLKETPRSTSVVAGSGAAVTCLILDRVAFEEVVGDLDAFLARRRSIEESAQRTALQTKLADEPSSPGLATSATPGSTAPVKPPMPPGLRAEQLAATAGTYSPRLQRPVRPPTAKWNGGARGKESTEGIKGSDGGDSDEESGSDAGGDGDVFDDGAVFNFKAQDMGEDAGLGNILEEGSNVSEFDDTRSSQVSVGRGPDSLADDDGYVGEGRPSASPRGSVGVFDDHLPSGSYRMLVAELDERMMLESQAAIAATPAAGSTKEADEEEGDGKASDTEAAGGGGGGGGAIEKVGLAVVPVLEQAAAEGSRGADVRWATDAFELLDILGIGTFGVVRLVRELASNRYYALKRMSKAKVVAMKQQQHVKQERELMAELIHPFILRLYDTAQDEDNVLMLLEYVQGGELFGYIAQFEHVPSDVSRFYMACVLCATAYLHERGIVYRDLKPENLMIDRFGYLKVIDFGFAKRIGDGRTYTVCGTVEYLSPEVIMGRAGYDYSADIWAMGVLLYELLCGHSPFAVEGGTQTDTMKNIIRASSSAPTWAEEVKDYGAQDLIVQLLAADVFERIGCRRAGLAEVREHPWFSDMDWTRLLRRQITPPWIPDVEGPEDLKHFDYYSDDEDEDDPALQATNAANRDDSWAEHF